MRWRTKEDKNWKRQKKTFQNRAQRKRLPLQDLLFLVDLRARHFRRYNDLKVLKVLGGLQQCKILFIQALFCTQVHRVLPQWLAEPGLIHRDIKSNLVPISAISGVCAQLLKKLESNGIQHFFPGTETKFLSNTMFLFKVNMCY